MVHASADGPAFGQPITLEAWADLPEDEPGEVVGGILVEEEVPDIVHEILAGELARELGNWVRPRGGLVSTSGTKYRVAPDGGRMPDLSVFFADDLPRRGALMKRPPTIALEIVSKTARDQRRDRVAKRKEYAAFGVRYYWLLDPEARTLEILELLPDGRYAIALSASEGRHEHVPGCDGFVLDLDALWATVDRLAADADTDADDP